MGGVLTHHRLFTGMKTLKDHSLWHFYRTWVRNYFWFILVIVIQLSLLIIQYSRYSSELDRKCPEDQAKLHHTISQLEAENLALKKQLARMEKEKQRVKNVTNQTLEKTVQLLEKTKAEGDGLSKQLSVSNQSLAETRRLLEKATEERQRLQGQLEIAKEDFRKTQQQRDSLKNQLAETASLKTVVEKAKEKMKKTTSQNLEKAKQLLEKSKQDNHGLQEQLAILNQTLAETQHLLEKAKKDIRGLQVQLETTSQDHRKSQEHLDSCQNQLYALEEKLKSPDSATREIQGLHDEIEKLKSNIKQEQILVHNIGDERNRCWNEVTQLQFRITHQQRKCSIQDILEDGSILGWGVGILVLFLCCIKCCR